MDDEKPDECQSCHYKTGALIDYPTYGDGSFGKTRRWLCDLCASTNAGRSLEYPDQFPHGDTLRTICYVGNVILARIDAFAAEFQKR